MDLIHHIIDQVNAGLRETRMTRTELGVRIGKNVSYVSNLLNGQIKDPSASTLIKLCEALHLSVDEMAGLTHSVTVLPADQQNISTVAQSVFSSIMTETKRRLDSAISISVDDVMAWWHREGGNLRDYDAIKDHVGLFSMPSTDATCIEPQFLGRESLAADFFEVETCAELLKKIRHELDADLNERLVGSYVDVGKNGPSVSFERIRFRPPKANSSIEISYMRALLPVVDESTEKSMILNFSKFLPNVSQNQRSVTTR